MQLRAPDVHTHVDDLGYRAASLWALPLAMVLAAGASAYVALRINISVSDDPALYLYNGGAKETPQFLSNLVSSMMQA